MDNVKRTLTEAVRADTQAQATESGNSVLTGDLVFGVKLEPVCISPLIPLPQRVRAPARERPAPTLPLRQRWRSPGGGLRGRAPNRPRSAGLSLIFGCRAHPRFA